MRSLLLSTLLITCLGCDTILGIDDHSLEQDAGYFDDDGGRVGTSHSGGAGGQITRTSAVANTGGATRTQVSVGGTASVSVGGYSSPQSTGTLIPTGGARASTTVDGLTGGAPIVLASGGASMTHSTGGRAPVGGTRATGGAFAGGTSSWLAQGTGGNAPATGGTIAGTGGAQSTGGNGAGSGGTPSTGGLPSTGGAASTGGNAPATGGVVSTGGNTPAAGGAVSTGGSPAATGGAQGTGGSPAATGGAQGTGGSPAATGGTVSTGGTQAVTGGAVATGGTSALSAIQQACADTCALTTAEPKVSKCKLASCNDRCAAIYDDTGVVGVAGCRDAYLESLQCGATEASSGWTCDLGLPMPTDSLSCLVPIATLVALPGCSDALATAAAPARD